jgi:hypothetical protein
MSSKLRKPEKSTKNSRKQVGGLKRLIKNLKISEKKGIIITMLLF